MGHFQLGWNPELGESRFYLSFLEGNVARAAFDNTFGATVMFDSDPISVNFDNKGTTPSNNVLQPIPGVDAFGIQMAPPGAALVSLGPSLTATMTPIDYGDYMSMPLGFPFVSCVSEVIPLGTVNLDLTCHAATAWPFFPVNSASPSGVGLGDDGTAGSNPP